MSNKEEILEAKLVIEENEEDVTVEMDAATAKSTAETQAIIDEIVSDVIGQDVHQTVKELEQSMNEPEEVKQPVGYTATEGVSFIARIMEYLGSLSFVQQCETLGKKHQLPAKCVAKNFCMRILGMIGDVLNVAINVTRNFITATIELLASILKSGVNMICDVADGLARIVTLNQTVQC